MKTFVLLLAAGLTLGACSETWNTTNLEPTAKKAEVTQTMVEDVTLTSAKFDAEGWEKLANLDVTVNKTTAFHPEPTTDAVKAKLKLDAAKLNATKVFEVEVSDVQISALSWGTRKGTGIAARPK